jgi:hypothetical protein
MNRGLSKAELEFLCRLIAEHRAYYETLAMHPKCSRANRDQRLFIDTLWQKLSSIQANDGRDGFASSDGLTINR